MLYGRLEKEVNMKSKSLVLIISFVVLIILILILMIGGRSDKSSIDLDVIKNKLTNINDLPLREMTREEVMNNFGLELEMYSDSLFLIDSVTADDINDINVVVLVINYDDLAIDAIKSYITLHEGLDESSIQTKENILTYVSGPFANDIRDIMGVF